MLSKLREILLTQYIGAILIALLISQAASQLVAAVVRTGFWFYDYRRSESVLARPSTAPFRWHDLILESVRIALHLLTAYGIARWLYSVPSPTPQADVDDDSYPEPGDPDISGIS